MSGGHWDYVGGRICLDLSYIAEDEAMRKRWPQLGGLLRDLGGVLRQVEHDMDWDLSGDTQIEDDAAFERQAIGAILEVALKAAPDEWFPRGKWATIQAVQGRM